MSAELWRLLRSLMERPLYRWGPEAPPSSQKAALEQRNAELEGVRQTLEERVRARTAELERVNEELRLQIVERAEAEREVLRAQFFHAQKMESVGRLAGGVAHDFNNLLSAIIGYSELALNRVSGDADLSEDLRIVLDAGNRAAVLTRQLLALSRRQALEIRVVNINEIIESLAKILLRTIGESVDVELRLCPDLDDLRADVGQIELLLADLSLRGASGRELVADFTERYPRTRAVLMSGFAEGAVVGLEPRSKTPFIPKPLTPSRLSVVIRQVLDR